MGVGVTQVHHIQIFVAPEFEQATKRFYSEVIGLEEIPKPEVFHKNEGAWYQHGPNQLHLSLLRHAHGSAEGAGEDNRRSQRHVCYMVADLAHAEKVMRAAGVEILPDERPFAQWTRFYVRDPGGNYIEIAQMNAPRAG
jgi:catechol 2,3-dioxygenase-like lactoylglutathione lyase family enzyme